MSYSYQQLQTTDLQKYKELMKLFANVFEDTENYQSILPDDAYIEHFLGDTSHIVLVAVNDQEQIVGGLVAYELQKFEQARSEIFIYDLAVFPDYQRQGIATGLLITLKEIAAKKGAYVIFVQADKEDEGAVAFYRTISSAEVEGSIFDIPLQ